jgi:hypothetical protein
MIRALVVVVILIVLSPAFAHDGVHDEWLKKLKNGNGIACCESSEAFSVDDPDWEISKDRYRVRQSPQHQWIDVSPTEVVTEKNILGVAKVWPTIDASGTWTSIRCFLPGDGI